MTCASCLHSERHADGVLWCRFTAKPANARCTEFVYEPGTDEAER